MTKSWRKKKELLLTLSILQIQLKNMGILAHFVHIQIGNTMPKGCVIIVIIHKEGSNKRLFANIKIEWLMQEECATVATKLKNGKNKVVLKKITKETLIFEIYLSL